MNNVELSEIGEQQIGTSSWIFYWEKYLVYDSTSNIYKKVVAVKIKT